jgi:hypothetical protein
MSTPQANRTGTGTGRLTDSAQQRDSDPRPAGVVQDVEVAPSARQKVPGVVRGERGLDAVDKEESVDEALDESAVVGKGEVVYVWWE